MESKLNMHDKSSSTSDNFKKLLVDYEINKQNLLSGLQQLDCPSTIKDEVEKILLEGNNYYPANRGPLLTVENIFDYLSCQQQHLSSIREKLGKNNEVYLRISSTIVELAIITILASLNNAELMSKGNMMLIIDKNDLNSVYTNAYKAVKGLILFDMEDNYRNKRFNPQKKIITNCCKSKLGVKSLIGCMAVIVAILVISLIILFAI